MAEPKLDIQTVIDGLGQGVLIFDKDGHLVTENMAARTILGTDLDLIHQSGWQAASMLLNPNQADPDKNINAIRDRALTSARPIRFFTYRSGEHIPCWASTTQASDGAIYLMITLDVPDWSAMANILDRFTSEMQDAVETTIGHVNLIEQTIAHHTGNADSLGKRVSGFTRLIGIHMDRVNRLMDMLKRLETIRMGTLRETLKRRRKKVHLADFLEDFVEELDEIQLVDPETEARDHRSRLRVDVDDNLTVSGSRSHLTVILRDLLRNAIMYSIRATPITVKAQTRGNFVQLDVVDEGYGIRERERERVFEAFQRARQPQVIGEFGYGLSLYLCKHEVEAMNGKMWFESTEGVGTTFSIMLPVWHEDASDESLSSSSVSASESASETESA